MIKPKGLGRGLDALLGGDERGAVRERRSATLPVDRAAAGPLPAAHAHGRRSARRARRIDQARRA